MIRTIVHKEFLSHLLTFRFWTAAVLCFVLVPVILNVSIRRYEERLENYRLEVDRFASEVRSQVTYSFVRPTLVRPPQVLGVLVSGIEDDLGAEVPVRLGSIAFLPSGRLYGRENPFLAAPGFMDVSFILVIVLSLFSLLLTYDAFSGEKEGGALRQMLSNQILRRQIFFGKLIGALTVVVPLVFCSFGLIVLNLALSPAVRPTSEDLLRISLIFIATNVYASLFLLIGLLVSARSEHSPASLMRSMFVWVVLVLVIPGAGFHAARELSPVPSMQELSDNLRSLEADQTKAIDGISIPAPTRDLGLINFYFRSGDDGQIAVANNTREGYDYFLAYLDAERSIRTKFAERKAAVEESYADALENQAMVARRLSMISPAFDFVSLAEAAGGVDEQTYRSFIPQAQRYRLAFVRYLEEKRRADPYRYVAPQDARTILPFAEWLPYWTNGKFTTYGELFDGRSAEEGFSRFRAALDTTGKMAPFGENRFPRVDVSDLPGFTYVPPSLSDGLEGALPEFSILLAANLLLAILALRSFNRYDVR